jgi:hypothetical protein
VIFKHLDRIGRELSVGDYVAYPQSNSLSIGTITKLNPKMIKVKKINSNLRREATYNKYGHDCVLLNGPAITLYLLKNSKS